MYAGAGPLRRRPGAPVLVVGGAARSVALYAVASARALGSEQVDYVDTSPQRLEIAARLGARPIRLQRTYAQLAKSRQLLGGGYPITVEGSGGEVALPFAIRALSVGGVCTTVFFHLRAGTPVPLWFMYLNGATLATGLANVRADLPAILESVASGRLHPERVTTLEARWDDAPQALLDPGTKVVLVRDSDGAPRTGRVPDQRGHRSNLSA